MFVPYFHTNRLVVIEESISFDDSAHRRKREQRLPEAVLSAALMGSQSSRGRRTVASLH